MGMKQRLGIAQAIMEKPEILILDEPMNGLDNDGVMEMRKLFINLREEGTMIIIASHNKEDIEVLCDEVFEVKRFYISYVFLPEIIYILFSIAIGKKSVHFFFKISFCTFFEYIEF